MADGSLKLSEADRLKVESLLWNTVRQNPEEAERAWGMLQSASLGIPLTSEARRRLEWFVAYGTRFKGNVRRTCRYFGISRKTFYLWRKRFDVTNPRSLEDRSHRPKHSPLPVLDPDQSACLYMLRFAYPYYSKMKIAALYERLYGKKVSCWQVQKIIERYQLYPDPKRARSRALKRLQEAKKTRVTKITKMPKTGFLVGIDTVHVTTGNRRFYMLTALDTHSRWGFARLYRSHSSKAAAGFLHLLQENMKGTIRNIQTDNGSEFHRHFQKAASELHLGHYWSRVRTPKDNAQLERFNRTIREEFLVDWPDCTDIALLNGALFQWLCIYNYERPHTAIQYRTPSEAAWGD